jgi:Kef-type K+ transport system membrane component KefB
MNVAAAPRTTFGQHVLQALLLAGLFVGLYAATRAVPEIHGGAGTVGAIGFLLLAGTLTAELVELVKLPHLTGYLAAGIVAGPFVLNLVDHASIERLTSVNALALSLIALEGGAELKIDMVRACAKSLAWATLFQTVLVMLVMTAAFMAARSWLPFVHGMAFETLLGVALLWAMIGITRSPAATLGIMSQTRARGPLMRFTLAFVMTSDVVVLTALALVMTVVRPVIEPSIAFSAQALVGLGHEIVGSVALGTTLGIVLILYLRLVGRQLVLVFLALGFGLTEVLRYVGFEPLLTFVVAGFIVQNLSKQGEKLVTAIQETGDIVYVVFFATAGAHLDLGVLAQLWKAAILLAVTRAAITWAAHRLGSRVARDEPRVARWGWTGLLSQAGVALGITAIIEREFPTFGAAFRALAIAQIAINEMVGPVIFKFALDRTRESARAHAPSFPSLRPPPLES